MPDLNATNLKEVLWETLNKVKNDEITPHQAGAIAAQAREILRTVNIQLKTATQAKKKVANNVTIFAECISTEDN